MIKQIKDSLGMRYGKSAVVVASIFGSLVFQACNESNFSGGAAKSATRGGIGKCKNPPCDVPPGPRPPVSLDMEFSGDKRIEPIQNTKIWTATTNGIIKRITINGNAVAEQKMWIGGGAGTGGMRSYVTEGGFLGARFPHLYFVDPETPLVVRSKNIGAQSRICVASYMKNGQRYMIAAWGSGSFQEYALDDKPPYAPKWDQAPTRQGQIQMVGTWGYSCFIDQQQKIFYSQFSHMGAIDLNSYQAANIATTAPNANFRSTTPGVSSYSMGSVKTSYAMSGDSYGNIYNGDGYTSAYDKASDSVWFSHRSAGKIVVIDRKCLTTQTPCSNFHTYTSGVPTIGPMSPLRDGRIVGLVRGSGDIYLMNLRDKTNLKSGLEVVKVGSAGGDPYMYTDFTGATLYINESEQTFKPVEMAQFSASKPIKTAVFKWKATSSYAAGSLSVEWRNIKLEARCYTNGANKPEYAEIVKVHPSDKGTELNVKSCAEGKYEHVDVKLTQLNNDSSLAGIETISVGFKQ